MRPHLAALAPGVLEAAHEPPDRVATPDGFSGVRPIVTEDDRRLGVVAGNHPVEVMPVPRLDRATANVRPIEDANQRPVLAAVKDQRLAVGLLEVEHRGRWRSSGRRRRGRRAARSRARSALPRSWGSRPAPPRRPRPTSPGAGPWC